MVMYCNSRRKEESSDGIITIWFSLCANCFKRNIENCIFFNTRKKKAWSYSSNNTKDSLSIHTGSTTRKFNRFKGKRTFQGKRKLPNHITYTLSQIFWFKTWSRPMSSIINSCDLRSNKCTASRACWVGGCRTPNNLTLYEMWKHR